MAGASFHIASGCAAGIITSVLFSAFRCGGHVSQCILDRRQLFLIAASALFGVFGGLFPDIDANKGRFPRAIFFVLAILAGTVSAAAAFQDFHFNAGWSTIIGLAAAAFFFGILLTLHSILVNHRGIFHSFPMLLTMPAWTGVLLLASGKISSAASRLEIVLCGSFAGMLTHLLIDWISGLGGGSSSVFKLRVRSTAVTVLTYVFLFLGAILNIPEVYRRTASAAENFFR